MHQLFWPLCAYMSAVDLTGPPTLQCLYTGNGQRTMHHVSEVDRCEQLLVNSTQSTQTEKEIWSMFNNNLGPKYN